MKFTHIGKDGYPNMVPVGGKEVSERRAAACGCIRMKEDTLTKIKEGALKKGDVLSAAKIAGIMAAKKTSELIPLCHNIMLEKCEMSFDYPNCTTLSVKAEVSATAKTGVEMEAITAVSTALITVYDMAKAVDRGMVISDIMLLEKDGGRSGHYIREENQ